ncbi:proton channel OtopLc-like [Anopheles ziemanni]|uniref:proton channel OtopLc-like n=1 Tax=Anopheles coustani TaxID=139045 RepID=UPI00265B1DE8|nr:proton channel OtopLc-like [Anopheles coustani]XP_058175603.1 proton channel OtopLc-like [Anopheles ziemanni]
MLSTATNGDIEAGPEPASVPSQAQNVNPMMLTVPSIEIEEPQDADAPPSTPTTYQKRPASVYSVGGRPPPIIRAVSYQPSIAATTHQSSEHHIPPPSTPEEKSKFTRRYLAGVTGISYALFLIVFGLIAFITDAVENNARYPLAEVFALYMVATGIIYFVFLYVDIRLYVWRAQKALLELQRRRELYEEELQRRAALNNGSAGGVLELGTASANGVVEPAAWQMAPLKPIPHDYCFVTGRHGEIIYLKLGATWFCFGLLIHSVLLLSYQGILMNSRDGKWAQCASNTTIAMEVLFLVYCLFLIFFFWKYANIVINRYRGLARFGIMHAIGTALAFWVLTIVRETVVAIRIKQSYYDDYSIGENSTYSEAEVGRQERDSSMLAPGDCPGPEELNQVLASFSPYLYPFVIEFNILIVGLLYMIYANISKCPKKITVKGHRGHGGSHHGHGSVHGDHVSKGGGSVLDFDGKSECSDHCDDTLDHEAQVKTRLVVYGDCQHASRGLFAGLILVVATIVVIILFHIASRDDDYRDTGILLDGIFEVTVLGIMILATVAAYFQTSKLDINPHPISRLDDVLLFIAIPAFFSETLFSMIPAFENSSILNGFIVFTQIVQVLLQTPWICDALRRCSNTEELQKKKPGKELVTFMTIANVSLWIYYTFAVKTGDFGDERYDYYGDVLWSILNHLSLPLIMFYRFHSSVCLVDIWRHSYEPGELAH